jgi:hypothetical protein
VALLAQRPQGQWLGSPLLSLHIGALDAGARVLPLQMICSRLGGRPAAQRALGGKGVFVERPLCRGCSCLQVLVVDDDPMCLKVVSAMLQRCHYEGGEEGGRRGGGPPLGACRGRLPHGLFPCPAAAGRAGPASHFCMA